MTLTLTIDNATEATRIVNDYCAATRYDPASGKTKVEWMKEYLIKYLKNTAKQGEGRIDAAIISAAIDAIVIT